jgi:hypothetical protein
MSHYHVMGLLETGFRFRRFIMRTLIQRLCIAGLLLSKGCCKTARSCLPTGPHATLLPPYGYSLHTAWRSTTISSFPKAVLVKSLASPSFSCGSVLLSQDRSSREGSWQCARLSKLTIPTVFFLFLKSSYVTTDGQSASLSWCQAPVSDPRPIFPFLL